MNMQVTSLRYAPLAWLIGLDLQLPFIQRLERFTYLYHHNALARVLWSRGFFNQSHVHIYLEPQIEGDALAGSTAVLVV